MSARTRVAALLLFGSGFCALIYQTTWLREFRLIFGASTAASAAVLGVFMGGLGFGGIILGRYSETRERPLRFYGKLELMIAISAALSPLLVLVGRWIYVGLGGTETMGIFFGTIVRLILVALILGVPTFLMGGTLPAVARAIVANDDTSRRSLGVLYGVNTLGAVMGALAGTFYLFENFGNHLSLWWAALLNIIVALIALRVSRSLPALNADSDAFWKASEPESATLTKPVFVFLAAALVGFAFFLMEMVWYRMLAPLLGGSTFTFGLILAVALFGIGLGGVVYSFFDLKRTASMRVFALTCGAEAFFIALPYALGDRIAMAAMLLRPLGTLGFHGHVIAWTCLCLIIIFPAAFISGLQFPLLIALLGRGRNGVASQTGAAYAWNTIGALIGSLAGGFGFMPLFSAPGVWKMVVVILATLAILATLLSSRESHWWIRALLPLAAAAAALAMLAATGPTAFWRHSQIGVGGIRQYHASANEIRDLISAARRRTLWQIDGRESSVALANSNSLAFIVNGKSDGNAKADAGTQIMSGMIGAALHPNPQKAMVVGLGTGSTAGWLASVPSMQRVDVVELERGILKVAELCAPVNRNALTNPKLHVTIGDGRELLLTTREKYDLIVSEPSNPYRAGVAGLFTREFYESVEKCLQPGGIFLQWVQTYDVDDRTIEIFYRTLGSVFRNIESWQTEEGDLLLMATREEAPYDATLLRRRLEEEPFKSALAAAWRAQGLEDFLGRYVGNSSVARTLANLQPGPLNTDDQTVIEFAFARSLSTPNGFQMVNLRNSAHSAHCDRPRLVNGPVDWTRVEEAKLCLYPTLNRAEQPGSWTDEERSRVSAALSYAGGDPAAALIAWRSQSKPPATLSELELVAESLAAAGDQASLKYVDQFAGLLPADAEAIRAELYLKQGKQVEAIRALLDFFRIARQDPWPNQNLICRSLILAESIAGSDPSREVAQLFYSALKDPFCVWNSETDRRIRLLSIARILDGATPGKFTASVLEPIEPNVFWERKFLEMRKDCYAAINSPLAVQARQDLDQFMNDQAFTADVPALTRVLLSAAAGQMRGAYATEGGTRSP